MSNYSPKIFWQHLKNYFWHLPKAIYANIRYGFPSRKLILIGITGTDGKTTACNLLYEVLSQAGYKTAVISTLGAKIDGKEYPIGLHTTSPDSTIIQSLLHLMVSKQVTHAIIEVTAHALDQYRFFGCNFKISAITNTSHEHLDDFSSMTHYIMTKAKLFAQSQISILNKDDNSYLLISPGLTNYVSYSTIKPSDYHARHIKLNPSQLSFSVNREKFFTDSLYEYQIYNILLVLALLDKLNIDHRHLIEIIRNFPEIKGRRQIVNNDLKLRCIVDFAHTPAALKETLSSLRKTSPGRIIVIFGATGGRDSSKRPIMGQVVSQIADIAIITSDDTRQEKVEDINRQIISGIDEERVTSGLFSYHNIPNRQEAFNLAVKLAKSGDTIIACGKGHEDTILIGTTEYPWSESEAFRTAFRVNN